MRRFTATLIIALACGVPLAPLLPAGAPAVPACCRRNGAHHCMMMMSGAMEGPAVAVPAARCPYRDALAAHSSVSRTHSPLQFAHILRIEYRHSVAAATYLPDAAVAAPHDRGPPACSTSSPSQLA
jgi:hypothetical protein